MRKRGGGGGCRDVCMTGKLWGGDITTKMADAGRWPDNKYTLVM